MSTTPAPEALPEPVELHPDGMPVVPLPKMRPSIFVHPQLGELFDHLTVQLYAMGYAQEVFRAALASRDAELAKLRGWRDAVDEALVTAHIGVATEPYDDLNKLLQWHHDIWLDPAVSSDAEALVEQGRAQAAKLRQGEPVAWRYKGAGWERWIYRTDPPRNTQHEYIVEPLYASPPPSQAPAPVPAAQARKALQPLSYHELWASDDLMAVNAEVGFRMQDIIKIARAIERLITERMSAAKETK